jgi:hypothetical protein
LTRADTLGPGVDVSREIADSVDVVPGRWNGRVAEGGEVKPLVRSAFQATIIEVEAVDVDVGFHP